MASETKKTSIFSRFGRYIRDVIGELKKVVWPSKKDTLHKTGIVILFIAVMAIVVGLFDLGMIKLLNLIFGV